MWSFTSGVANFHFYFLKDGAGLKCLNRTCNFWCKFISSVYNTTFDFQTEQKGAITVGKRRTSFGFDAGMQYVRACRLVSRAKVAKVSHVRKACCRCFLISFCIHKLNFSILPCWLNVLNSQKNRMAGKPSTNDIRILVSRKPSSYIYLYSIGRANVYRLICISHINTKDYVNL